MVRVKMQNPGPAALMVINPKRKGAKNMAARKRSTRGRPRAVAHRKPVRRANTRKASTKRVVRHHASHAVARRPKRRNPSHLFAKRRSVRRHRNPIGGAIGQAIPLVGASFAITFVAPIATRLVGGFLPLGNFTQPVVLAGTGYGLGWIAGKLGFGKYKAPLEIMGVTLGLTALVSPYLRGLMAPSAPAQPQQGMNGFRNRGLRGIAAVAPVPPMLMAPAPAARTMNGIATNQVPGSFGRGY